MSDTPTPRTDAVKEFTHNPSGGVYWHVPIDFARQLEREIAEAKTAYSKSQAVAGVLSDLLEEQGRTITELNKDRDRLQQELAGTKFELEQSNDALIQARSTLGSDELPFVCDSIKKIQQDRDRWRKMCEDACSLIKEMDDDLKDNLPEYERLDGVTEILSRFNAMKGEIK